MPDGTLDQPRVLNALEARLRRLTPDAPRQWGTLTPPEMMRHLIDSYSTALGERSVRMIDNFVSRTVMKYGALHTPIPWPKGVPTMPEADPKRKGSQPGEFEADRELLIGLMRRMIEPGARYGKHPAFGELSRDEWLIWGYRHADHHFRQFGI